MMIKLTDNDNTNDDSNNIQIFVFRKRNIKKQTKENKEKHRTDEVRLDSEADDPRGSLSARRPAGRRRPGYACTNRASFFLLSLLSLWLSLWVVLLLVVVVVVVLVVLVVLAVLLVFVVFVLRIDRVNTEVTFGRGHLSVCPLGGFTGAQEWFVSDWRGVPLGSPQGQTLWALLLRGTFCASLNRHRDMVSPRPRTQDAGGFWPRQILENWGLEVLPESVKKTFLFCQPLPCKAAAGTALQPLIWCFAILSSKGVSSQEECFCSTDSGRSKGSFSET